MFGELAPKRLALQRTEAVALAAAAPLDRIATLARPVIWLLSRTTDVVVRLAGGDPQANREAITEEELRGLVAAHESLPADERKLIDDVFDAGDRQVREVMVPRTEVEFLDVGTTVSRAARVAREAPHSRYPVVRRDSDDVVGFVHIRDLLDPDVPGGRAATVGALVREVKRLPGTKKVLSALSEMRREGHHLAIVEDEYGGTDGIVTLEDLIEELIGDIRDEYDEAGAGTRRGRAGRPRWTGCSTWTTCSSRPGCGCPRGRTRPRPGGRCGSSAGCRCAGTRSPRRPRAPRTSGRSRCSTWTAAVPPGCRWCRRRRSGRMRRRTRRSPGPSVGRPRCPVPPGPEPGA